MFIDLDIFLCLYIVLFNLLRMCSFFFVFVLPQYDLSRITKQIYFYF